MSENSRSPNASIYFVLFAIQVFGAIAFVWQELPGFRQVAINPGEQLAADTFADFVTLGILLIMQISFWYRQLHVPIPFRHPNMFLNHVFLFLGRLSFIFGSALFSVVVFRHLPELDQEINLPLAVIRGTILVGCLFALFCTSLEVERLGQAFEGNRK
jgi:hypothetical protein